MKSLSNIYFTNRFWWSLAIIAFAFVWGHFFIAIFISAKIVVGIVMLLFITDNILLFTGGASAKRIVTNRLSNGDKNPVLLKLSSNYSFFIEMEVIDELPEQFQIRDFKYQVKFNKKGEKEYKYELQPVSRGIYHFGIINLFCKTKIGLISRRFKSGTSQQVSVYPSFLQLKKTEMLAFQGSRYQQGLKKIRRIGNNKEFEQIKDYIIGDDYRKLNWKATARMNKLMVNEYQDERSQDVYQLIDMGRNMKMPFDGMTLLDYSINATLALGNIILKKNDKTGLLTYSTKVHSFLKSDSRKLQLHKLIETLYSQETNFQESNLESIYHTISKHTNGRSLLIFYTNYESTLSLERQMSILKKLSSQHLVLIISFINSEIKEIAERPAKRLNHTYRKILAEKNILEKNLFMDQLQRYGIINLRVKPQDLNMSVINKYLEIKNRGLI